MTSVDYVFKAVKYDAQTVNLTATVYLPQNTSSIKGIGKVLRWRVIDHVKTPC